MLDSITDSYGDLDGFITHFAQVCHDLADLANDIDASEWARGCFRPAYIALCDDSLDPKTRLQIAFDRTDVFRGMGSWDDNPPYRAYCYQKSADYQRLSDELCDCRSHARTLLK